MNRQIVYWAADNGMDGMMPSKCMYASFSETELDAMIAADPNKAWRRKEMEIVDVEFAKKKALAKLNGIDKLVIGLTV